MSPKEPHKWTFRARFRRNAFGWRSQPAIRRIKEAVSEIKKTARKDPVLGAEGAVLLLEKLSPAIAHVDSSSGAIGTAVNHAVETLVPIIANAPADETLRGKWLDRLWEAIQDDDMPYIESLSEFWGALCVTSECASRWADTFLSTVRAMWQSSPEQQGFFKGTTACLSALYTAGRNEDILDLLKLSPYKFWSYHQWGVRALAAMGRKAEALRYAEDCRGPYVNSSEIAEICEEILLSSGMAEEAYRRYAIEANQKTTWLATFRAVSKKYPRKAAGEILRDLVKSTPGVEGKWFAAAKSAGLYREAIELANRTPCDIRTLIRAARDMAKSQPEFAVEAGMAALRWLVQGYGYEITGLDVRDAYQHTMNAAEHAGARPETFERIRKLVAGEVCGERVVTRALGQELGLDELLKKDL
ncbi:MAG: hypothetical protein PHP23_06965 [Desulfobacterales bacterium]|nr:hypothetical protein [Desulfobacterales bacterium]MDD4071289.1 hypothetical protein [Desulfobacterales bacterium]MDD4393318.1 hypothetical protein [Desulfobacterales bacterium]